MMAPEELLTVKDVARVCQLHEVTVRRHIAAGRLRVVRIGRAVRVRREDLETYTEHQESGEPFRRDDPFLRLVGAIDDPSGSWVAGDKKRALAGHKSPAPDTAARR